MAKRIAWIGLGVMGFPMAGHLVSRGGHSVTVFNRTPEKADRWLKQFSGRSSPNPMEAAEGAEIVLACVGNDDDLREVTVGPGGAFQSMGQGSLFVDHTTASANVARELHAEAARRGIGFIDAPVSGGQAGAENGVLSIMCGGSPEDFARVEPVLAHYSRICRLLGPPGSGQLAKMCNQIAIAGLVQGLAEAIHFGMRAGLDMESVVEVISKGAAGSWQMDNRHKTMIRNEFSFGFAVDWMRKDLAICLDEARRAGAHLPVCAIVDQFYGQVQKMGGNRWDTSSLIALLQR
jgi:3-hydroxyisobutyrate dehydrogenase